MASNSKNSIGNESTVELTFDPSKLKTHIKCEANRFILSSESCAYYHKTNRYSGCKNCVVGQTQDYSKVQIDIEQHVKDNPARPGIPHSLSAFRFWNE